MRKLRIIGIVSLMTALTAGGLTACSPTVPMDVAASGTDPSCAEVMVRLPDTIEGLSKRETNAQATAAWGDPATVLMTCGLPAQPPTSLPCITIGTVDWLIDYTTNPTYTTATTHGRIPVSQIVIDNSENWRPNHPSGYGSRDHSHTDRFIRSGLQVEPSGDARSTCPLKVTI